ncbi:MAG TPA: outer membrane beta-barrel protein [Methylomirabilota bacterium]|nr:outer membrane beta-barrel protein [Methylomirabilota bacterium]
MTRLTKSVSAAVGVLCALLIAASPASAEWFSDLWAGATRTEREDLDLEIFGVTMTDEVNFSTTYAFGVRVGYWFDSARWLGVAAEVSYLRPDPDVTVFPVSALLMLRLPLLMSEEFPKGQIQPYIAGGPGLFSVKFAGDLGSDLGGRTSDRTYEVGLDARAGVTFLFTKEFGIFAEYRMTRVSPEWDVTILGEDATINTELVSHYLIGGISFRFDL